MYIRGGAISNQNAPHETRALLSNVYEENQVAVRIRMKKLGRRHRPFYRICAMDGRTPRDGRVLEQLGTYDPLIPETDARAQLNSERINYWLSVGALPSDRVKILIKKYSAGGTHAVKQKEALDRLAQKRARAVPPPRPASVSAAGSGEAPASAAPAPE